MDAGVAGVLALTVLKPQSCGIAGESPMLLWRPPAEAARDKLPNPLSINGQGTAPRAATIEWFRSQGIDMIPGDGLLATTVPATFDACIEALRVGGRLSIVDVLEPAVELAREGFAVYPSLREGIARDQHVYRDRYPSTGSVCLDDGAVPKVGWWYRQPEWAATFQGVLDAAVRARSGGREAELKAARDHFYRGPIAARLAEFARTTPVLDATGRANRGLIDEDDFANYRTRLEEPVTVDYRGLDVYKCDSWTQGPVFLQQLRLLEGFDLPALGHNSAEYIHVLTRGGEARVRGPRALLRRPGVRGGADAAAAVRGVRRRTAPPDRHGRGVRGAAAGRRRTRPGPDGRRRSGGHGQGHDAHRRDRRRGPDVRRDAVAAAGSRRRRSCPASASRSARGSRSSTSTPSHPNALRPGKRPRTTLTPSLATRDGRPEMVFGTPGGDNQDQHTLQAFLNIVEFGMDLQAAMDAPLFHTPALPDARSTRTRRSRSALVVEGRIPDATDRRPARARPRRGRRRRLGAGPGERRSLPSRHRPDRGRRLAALDGRLRDGPLTRDDKFGRCGPPDRRRRPVQRPLDADASAGARKPLAPTTRIRRRESENYARNRSITAAVSSRCSSWGRSPACSIVTRSRSSFAATSASAAVGSVKREWSPNTRSVGFASRW